MHGLHQAKARSHCPPTCRRGQLSGDFSAFVPIAFPSRSLIAAVSGGNGFSRLYLLRQLSHHYRDCIKITGRVVSIAMSTYVSVRKHPPSNCSVVAEIAVCVDDDVSHLPNISLNKHSDIRAPRSRRNVVPYLANCGRRVDRLPDVKY